MPIKIAHVEAELNRHIVSSDALILRAKNAGMTNIHVEMITELAFLRIYIAWENFLEESFKRFLAGASTTSGKTLKRNVVPLNMDVALKLLSGGRDYATWTSPSDVIGRAEIYFKDGEPFKSGLQPIVSVLNEMNVVRNRIAHRSPTSQKKFATLIRTAFGHGVTGMTPGRFLSSMNANTTATYFAQYTGHIKIVASNLLS